MLPPLSLVSCFFAAIIVILPLNNCFAEDWQARIIKQVNGGSIVVQNPESHTIFSHNADKAMIPASILKIATADALLTTLGKDYRVPTEFYLTEDNYLGIKSFGDPTLVSESLASIAKQLKTQLNGQVTGRLKGFWFDSSFFEPLLKIHGQSNSNNPYDSSVGAIIVNYNTVHIKKSKQGMITSAEPQTPLTATALQRAKNLSPGKHRINLGQKKQLRLDYFAELLQVFLQYEGVDVPVHIINKKIPKNSKKLFVYHSPAISEIIKKMFLFSNNLIANQLLIILGGLKQGIPASIDKGRQVVMQFLSNKIGISDFILEEGSGLSRKNKFTANQMMSLLIHFKPYKNLLRIDQERFQAKTGTLKGVSTYAGYMLSPSGGNYPFVIMLNNSRWGGERKKLAQMLYNNLVIE